MYNFALIGAAGYIAPRHLKAIYETNNNLVAATDPHDSVGILDKYFRNVYYFREFERFDRHLDKLRRNGRPIDYLTICSPNYLHDAHCRFGLRIGADVICEKPLVINPWHCDALKMMEKEFGGKINTILQLRLHKVVTALKEKYKNTTQKHDINLTYLTSRGPWYQYSWKGDKQQSGGLAMNIGVHFFDMLLWIFGTVQASSIYENSSTYMRGEMYLEHANVKWILSTEYNRLPQFCKDEGKTTYRSIRIDGEEIEFSDGFADLHTESYKQVLLGNGFTINDVKPSIDLIYEIRQQCGELEQ